MDTWHIQVYHSWCSQTACPRVRDIQIGQWKFSSIWPASSVIHKLQMVQHAAARVITRTRTFHSITPVLKKMHWLPVHKRNIFKLLVLTYRSIRSTAPQYLSSLLRSHQPSRTLRFASQALTVDRTRLDTYGSRAFSMAGPALCNEQPHAIKCAETLSSFKSQSKKTYLLPNFYCVSYFC